MPQQICGSPAWCFYGFRAGLSLSQFANPAKSKSTGGCFVFWMQPGSLFQAAFATKESIILVQFNLYWTHYLQ